MSQHTPGPWRVDYHIKQEVAGTVIRAGAYTCPAIVLDAALRWKGEEQANARLIAAAPEMLKAIEHLRAACDTLMNEVANQRATHWGIVNDALVESTALLAKVKGKP